MRTKGRSKRKVRGSDAPSSMTLGQVAASKPFSSSCSTALWTTCGVRGRRRWRLSTRGMLGACHTSPLPFLPALVLQVAKLRLREGHLLAPHLSGSPRMRARVCPPPEPSSHLDFFPRKRADGAHHREIRDLAVHTGPQCPHQALLTGSWARRTLLLLHPAGQTLGARFCKCSCLLRTERGS